jgi:hypothetical protein
VPPRHQKQSGEEVLCLVGDLALVYLVSCSSNKVLCSKNLFLITSFFYLFFFCVPFCLYIHSFSLLFILKHHSFFSFLFFSKARYNFVVYKRVLNIFPNR